MSNPQGAITPEVRCGECLAGRHSACVGDFSMRTLVTCRCGFCKAYIDEHGPFALPPDEEVAGA